MNITTKFRCPLHGEEMEACKEEGDVYLTLLCNDGCVWEVVEDAGFPEFFSLRLVQR